MMIVFLEIHGVLIIPVCEMIARLEQNPITAYKPTIEALNFITDATNAKIVVTSEWRNAGQHVVVEKLREWGAKARVEDITPAGGGREEEITKYLMGTKARVLCYHRRKRNLQHRIR